MLAAVKSEVSTQRWRINQFNGRPHVHIDDYLAWDLRDLPAEYLTKDRRLPGIPVQKWNQWIGESSRKNAMDAEGLILSEMEPPLFLRDRETIADFATFWDAEIWFRQRSRAIDAIVNATKYNTESSGQFDWLTTRQRKILTALNDYGTLSIGMLARKLPVSVRTLHKPGALAELRAAELISHDGHKKGYSITNRGKEALSKK